MRNTIIGQMTDMFGNASVNFLDMASHQAQLGQNMLAAMRPVFADLGLLLDNFTVENISLPEELQKMLDQRISMNMIGDMGRYTQFQVAQSMPIAAANEGGGLAGAGVGLRRGNADGAADDERGASAGGRSLGWFTDCARSSTVAARRGCGRHEVLHELRALHSQTG